MKKIILSLLTVVMLVMCSTTILAAENASFGIGLTASKTQVNQGDEITVTLKVKDFKNVTEGIYSYLAKIEYDKNFFETLTETSVKGLGTWSALPTYNPETGLITADSGMGVLKESDVFTITFKVKSTAEIGKTTQIVVKDFEASEGEVDIAANTSATVDISIIAKTNDPETNNPGTNNPETNNPGTSNPETNNPGTNNPGTNNPGTSNPETNNPGTNNSGTNNSGTNNQTPNTQKPNNSNTDNTIVKDKLPQTGERNIILVSIFVVSVIGLVSYVKYRKMKM